MAPSMPQREATRLANAFAALAALASSARPLASSVLLAAARDRDTFRGAFGGTRDVLVGVVRQFLQPRQRVRIPNHPEHVRQSGAGGCARRARRKQRLPIGAPSLAQILLRQIARRPAVETADQL